MEDKKALAKESLRALAELEAIIQVENIVKDNQIEFKVDEVLYRIRKPNFAERQEVDNVRRKKYLEYIKDDSYFFRKQWVEKYKIKGIDIEELENKTKSIQHEIEQVLLRLATVQNPKDIESLKREVLKLRDEQFTVSMEITDLMSYSIEDQIVIFVNMYTTYLVLEKQENNNWIKAYSSFEEFKKSNDKVIEQAFYYINYLVYQYEEKHESNSTKKTS